MLQHVDDRSTFRDSEMMTNEIVQEFNEVPLDLILREQHFNDDPVEFILNLADTDIGLRYIRWAGFFCLS